MYCLLLFIYFSPVLLNVSLFEMIVFREKILSELDSKMGGNVDLGNSMFLLMAGSVYFHDGVS